MKYFRGFKPLARFSGRIVATGLAISLLAAGHAHAEKVLRVNMHSDLKIVDPIWTTAYMSRNYGYMVYDTLFAMNTKGEIMPQMVDTFTISDDGLTYDFTLRDGLKFHDDQPVTGEDVVASLQRWGQKDAMGQKMMTFVDEMSASDNGFQFKLNAPTGMIINALGKPSSNVPFIMPARIAATAPGDQITEYVGSGPFVFIEEEWKPGDKAEFAKFEGYVPRSDPSDGLAGAKEVFVDKVVWQVIRDQQTKMNALSKGELDVIEQPSHDLLPLMEQDDNIQLVDLNPFGNQYTFRFNVLHPPFDNPKMRQALMYAFDQEEFLLAAIGDEKYYTLCKAMFICGTPIATEAGFEDMLSGNLNKARELVEEAGYDGTPILLMHPTDLTILEPLPPVAKSIMEKIGLNVDMQAMDWQTLVGRRNKQEAIADGGWNAFITAWNSVDNASPLTTPFLNAACDKALFGWPCDEEIQTLRDEFSKEPDPAKQLALVEKLQMRVAEYPTHIHLGQYYQPHAIGANISGATVAPVPVFWGYKIAE
ncbi:MAG: ABC transporter substrate-binding protein [Granulosicoccus sp.]